MKAIENNQIFTEVSSEEAVTINGGLLGWRQVFVRRRVRNRFGRIWWKWYVRWVPA